MPKISRPFYYLLLAALGVGAYMFYGDEPVKANAKHTLRKPAASEKNAEGFDDLDFKAKFASVSVESRNVFNPLVQKTRTSAELALSPDAVPAELAGGDPNWVYTGTAELDGKPTALLENRVTGESEFVNKGQSWKRCSVSEILSQGLVLASPSGKKVRLILNNNDGTIVPGPSRIASSGFQPVNPALRGPIGANGVSVRPDRSGARGQATEAPDAN